MEYSNISLFKYCKEQDLEIVAVKLKLVAKNLIVFCAYRAPGGNLEYFFNQVDNIFNTLGNSNTEYILCGDLNINYLEPSSKKTKLENLLNMYNLIGTVNFPTRTTNTSSSAIDIFVDKGRNYTIKPYINGLSDHDAQLLILNDMVQKVNSTKSFFIRNINKNTIAEFQFLLSMEQWEDVFNVTDVNIMFKNFLNTYLRCYNATFLKVNISTSNLINNRWITKGIKVSCKRKKELFVLCKIINNDNLKQHYKKYCRILTKIIRSAKKLHYNNIIFRSKNRKKAPGKLLTMNVG